MTYVQICLYNYILANLPPDVSADLPDIFYVFFLLWSCAPRGVALEFQGLSKVSTKHYREISKGSSVFLSLTR